jgi:hypothetical protein
MSYTTISRTSNHNTILGQAVAYVSIHLFPISLPQLSHRRLVSGQQHNSVTPANSRSLSLSLSLSLSPPPLLSLCLSLAHSLGWLSKGAARGARAEGLRTQRIRPVGAREADQPRRGR